MVSNGQLANQTTFNTAFMSRTDDTTTVGKVDLLNADVASGANVTNLQRNVNALRSYTGVPVNSVYNVLPSWSHNNVGASSDPLFTRADALTFRFSNVSGHDHSGSDGNGAPILATSLSAVRLRGSFLRGVNLAAVTGTSLVVTTQMSGKVNSTGDTVKGVVVLAPNNLVLIRDNTGATQGDQLVDANGDVIYGRITFAASVWTLSFFKNVAGTETAHSFTAQAVAWYYQELFNPITDAPIYSELASVPSDNATQDVIVATASLFGKAKLASAAPADIGSAAAVGTANGIVPNADHVHRGVASFSKSGSGALYGAVTITAGDHIALTQAGQDVSIALAQIATASFLGRTTAGTGNVETLTVTQATALLNNFVGDSGSGGTKGLVPAPAAGDAAAGKFLKSDGTWAAPSGGGGGGSIFWVEDSSADQVPTDLIENHARVYAFQSALGQALYAMLRVPSGYLPGLQVKARFTFYSPDASGTALMSTVATLVRPGTDAITSTANQRTSTNAAVTLGAGTVNKPQAVIADLTSATGQINGVAISAGDLIIVKLTRGTDTGVSDLKVPVYGSEVTFNG